MKINNVRKILAENIKFYRFNLKYTQEKLAEKCDLSPRYISDIENCNGNIPIDTLENIAINLQVEPYQLILKQKRKALPNRVNMK